MIPRLRDRQAGIEPLAGAGNWYGTTLRIYDPALDRGESFGPIRVNVFTTDRTSARWRHRTDRPGSEGRFDAMDRQ